MALISGVALTPGERVLDVGCGSGEFLRLLSDAGARVSGADPAEGMLDLARDRAPGAELRLAGFEDLPWGNATFDAVVGVNSLQFATDAVAGLREATRVLRPGGRIGIANWSEARHNDIEEVEAATDSCVPVEVVDDDYRRVGGLERLFHRAGLVTVLVGTVPVVWEPSDDESLIRGMLLAQPAERTAEREAAILAGAARFATTAGYSLHNMFRYAVATTFRAS